MNDESVALSNSFKCCNCGADLTYAPGTSHLKCEYCGAENLIEQRDQSSSIEEIDFRTVLSNMEANPDQHYQVHTIKCEACGSSTTLAPNVTSDSCPYCDSPLVIQNMKTASMIKPRYLLPFKYDHKQALVSFRKWVNGLWFAPGKLKKYATTEDKLNGIYIPHWTYDTETFSRYTGERGTNHTESYSVRENGRTVQRSRTVVRWKSVSGSVSASYDDVLVMASCSLPERYANKLEPWDLTNLIDYNEAFLSGYKSETYQIGLEEGFEKARVIIDESIKTKIRQDIGGDHQRIHSVNTTYDNITFKHILLPIWISAYKYNSKTYRFLINGRTGEVQGERPWSWVKITFAAIGAAALIGTAIYFLQPLFNK